MKIGLSLAIGGQNAALLAAAVRKVMRLAGSSGSFAQTPDNAALDVVGDLDVRFTINPDNWEPGSTQVVAGKWRSGTGQASWYISIEPSSLRLSWSANGSAATQQESATFTDGLTGPLLCRVTLDVDNGASGHTVSFQYWDGSAWVEENSKTAAGVTSVHASTEPLTVGVLNNSGFNPFAGVIESLEVFDGIGGSRVAAPEFTEANGGSFTDAAGLPWTVAGATYEEPA